MVSIHSGQSQKFVRSVDFVANDKGIFELKKVLIMPIGRLQQFQDAVIEVEFEIQGCFRSISGKATYDASHPDLGPVLRVRVVDPSGNFEILIAESEWSGSIEESKLPGCDYRLSLTSWTPC